MRFFLTTFLVFITSLSYAQNSEECRKKFLNNSLLEFKYHERQISVIGWTHSLANDQQEALAAITSAADKVRSSDCNGAKKTIQAFLDGAKDRLKASNRVETDLETLYMRSKFNTLGVEHSKVELSEIIDSATGENKVDRLLTTINEKCGDLKSETDDFLKVFPGPEYYFAKKMNGKVKIKPMEDNDLKLASLKSVSAETMNFDPDKETLSPGAKSLIEKIQNNIKQGQPPTDAEINAVVAAEVSPTEKAKLSRVFKDVKQVMSLVNKRNNFIATTAVQSEGDVAIVIGQAHVNGIANELNDSCHSTSQSPQSKQNSQLKAPKGLQ